MSDEFRTTPAATVHVELNDGASMEVELLTPEQALEVGIQPAAYQGEPGKSPKIGEDGYWYIWNWDTMDWENTGVYAKGGVNDYEELTNKPRINGVELSGNKSPGDLGLSKPITNSDIEALFVT